MTEINTVGVHHVGLTVPDIQQTASFFVETLGFEKVGQKQTYPALFVSDGVTMITLWQVQDPTKQVAFDRKNVVGLHHLALQVKNLQALEHLNCKLKLATGVTIEFGPEDLGAGPAKHMMCVIPGGIRLELIAPMG